MPGKLSQIYATRAPPRSGAKRLWNASTAHPRNAIIDRSGINSLTCVGGLIIRRSSDIHSRSGQPRVYSVTLSCIIEIHQPSPAPNGQVLRKAVMGQKRSYSHTGCRVDGTTMLCQPSCETTNSFARRFFITATLTAQCPLMGWSGRAPTGQAGQR